MSRYEVTLDLAGVTDKAGLMDKVARAVPLPDWFGRNWDALVDSLSDPGAWPAAAGEGLRIVVRDWQAYAKAAPEEWDIAQSVFTEAVDREPKLAVHLAFGNRR